MLSSLTEAAIGLDAPSRASRPARVRPARSAIRFCVGLIAISALTIAAMLAMCATVIPRAMGWETVSVNSGSMGPLIDVGDVLVAEPYEDQELSPGLVLVMDDPNGAGYLTHRLHSVNDDGTLTTKGDANRGPDSTPIIRESVAGIGRMVVPVVGWPTLWVGASDVPTLALALLALIAALYAARWGMLHRFDPWADRREAVPGPVSPWPAPTPPGVVAPPWPAPTAGDVAEFPGSDLARQPPVRSRLALLVCIGTVVVVALAAMLATSLAAFATTNANHSNLFSAAEFHPPSNLQLSAACPPPTPIVFRAATTSSTSGKTLTLAKPAGTANGDTMIAHIIASEDRAFTAPTGWTLVRRSTLGPFSALYAKTAGTTEPASYTWTTEIGTVIAAGLGTFANVSTVTPIEAHGGQSGTGSSIVAPSISPAASRTMLVAFWAIRDNGGVTAPASMTQRWQRSSSEPGPAGIQVQTTAATELVAGAGATGSRTALSSASADNVGQMVALRPSSADWGSVNATWTASPSTIATGYKLQRWLGAVQQNERTITPRTNVATTDTPVATGPTYTYRLFAYYNTWTSTAISNTIAVPTC